MRLSIKFSFLPLIIFFTAFSSVSSHAQGNLLGCEGMSDTLNSVLFRQIPEMQFLGPYIDGVSKGYAHAMTMISGCPNPQGKDSLERDYYGLYVGEDHEDHTVNLYTFYIKKDLKHILVYDAASDTTSSLEKARQTKSWKKAWASRKKWVEGHGR